MSVEKNHVKVMWLEPKKDYGKFSLVRSHQIICSNGRTRQKATSTALPAVSVGQEVLVRWGRGKNSAYRARIESTAGECRSRTKSEGSSSTRVPTRVPKQKRRTSEGTVSMSSSQQSEEDRGSLDFMISNHGNRFQEFESATEEDQNNLSRISDIVSEETDQDVAWAKPSVRAPKRSRTSCERLFNASPPDGDDINTLKEQERKRHLDLRLRVLKDAEHKLDHCIGMLRGLFHVVPELYHRLSGRSLPAKSSRRPCTNRDVDERQMDFEQRAAAFYEIVQDITELRSDPEFARWIAGAIVKFKN